MHVISTNLVQLHAYSDSVNSLCKSAFAINHDGVQLEENVDSEMEFPDSENEDSIEELEKKSSKRTL
jgi:hypothetical protein